MRGGGGGAGAGVVFMRVIVLEFMSQISLVSFNKNMNARSFGILSRWGILFWWQRIYGGAKIYTCIHIYIIYLFIYEIFGGSFIHLTLW